MFNGSHERAYGERARVRTQERVQKINDQKDLTYTIKLQKQYGLACRYSLT